MFYGALAQPAAARFVLGIGLVATVVASIGAWRQTRSRDEARFLARTEALRNGVAEELDRYAGVLKSARTLWGIHPPAVRDEWRAYVENLALSNSLPGLHALGFVERVPSARLPGFLEQVRRDTSHDKVSVDFQVHPQTSENEHYVVEFAEPLDSNRSDLGYDIGTEPNRREAAETARDSDKATLTHKIALVQAPQAAGVLLLLPVYSAGIQATNVALRRASLLGWIYAAFAVEDLWERVRLLGNEQVEVQVFDGTNLSPNALFLESPHPRRPGARGSRPLFEHIAKLDCGNRVWTLRFQTGPAFARTPWFSAPGYASAAGLGVCISLLAFGIARALASTKQRARALADEMTAKLRLQDHAMACARNGLFILDASRDDCPIIYANPAFEKITGYSTVEPIGDETLFLLRNGARPANPLDMRAMLQGGAAEHTVVREYRKGGIKCWAEFRLVPVPGERGERTHFLGIVEDVTERKRAEQQLAKAEQRYHELVDNLSVGVYRNTPGHRGRFLEVNPALIAMMEAASKEEMLQHNVSDLYVDPARRLELSEQILRLGSVKDVEVELHSLKGRKFWASITATMQTDGEGQPFFDGIVVDITMRKQAEEQLRLAYEELAHSQAALIDTVKQLKVSHEQLEKTQLQLIQSAKMECIGTLAAGVAHEVKNPLQTILMGLDYVNNSLPQRTENVGLVLGDMRDAVVRADSIIRELLQLSADTAFELTQGDLNGLVERSLRLLNAELVAARTNVVCRLEPSLPPVRMDARKMEQVLLNIFINALQAMTQGGTLRVTTRSGRLGEDLQVNGSLADQFRPGERLVVAEVQDTGPGIDPQHLARIFDPFFTTKPVGKGTGLGLSVVKKIIDLHKGALEVLNAPEGGVVVILVLRA